MNFRSPSLKNRTNYQKPLKIGNSQSYIDQARETLHVFYEHISEYLGWESGEARSEESGVRESLRDVYSRVSQILGWTRNYPPPDGPEPGEPDLLLYVDGSNTEDGILEGSEVFENNDQSKEANTEELLIGYKNDDRGSIEEFEVPEREDDISEPLHQIIIQLEAFPIVTALVNDIISTVCFIAEQDIRMTSELTSSLSDARLEASIIVAKIIKDMVKFIGCNENVGALSVSDLDFEYWPMTSRTGSDILVDGPSIEEIIQSRQSPSSSRPTVDMTLLYPSLCTVPEYVNEEPPPESVDTKVCRICAQRQKTVHFHEDLNETYMIPIESGHFLTPLPRKESSQVNVSNKAKAKEEKKKQPKPEKEHKPEKSRKSSSELKPPH